MPIVVVCPCGAKLKAPDAAAGKRVKCPKCASALTVPAAEVSDFEMMDDDPPPVATPAKKKPTPVDDDDDAPRPAKKPAAAKSKPAPVEVNEAVDDDEDEEDAPKKKRRRDDDDEDDTPRKRKGKKGKKEKEKSNLPLILGIGGGAVVLLAVVGIIVGVMMSGGGGQAKGTGTTPTTPPKPALPTGWSEFKGEGFRVAVPDAIQFKKQEQQGPNAGGPRPPADTNVYSNGVQPQPQPNGPPIFIYVVSVGSVPPAAAAEFAKSPEAGWEAVKKSSGAGAQLQNEKVIQVAGAEGRQYTVNAGFVAGIVRVVVKGEKVYSCMVMSQVVPAEDSPEVKPFFDTFGTE